MPVVPPEKLVKLQQAADGMRNVGQKPYMYFSPSLVRITPFRGSMSQCKPACVTLSGHSYRQEAVVSEQKR